MYFKKKDFKYLSQFEDNFRTSVNSDYTRNVPISSIEAILKIYKTIEPNYVLCKTCPKSVLRFLKRVGKFYFKDKEELNNKENKK